MNRTRSSRIAIVGGGIAGISAAYLLNKQYDITLYEKDNRMGGNAYTHRTGTGETMDIAVGSVVKDAGAANFLKLCQEVNVKMGTQPRNGYVSMHDLETNDGVYLTPFSIKGLWAQKFKLYSSLRMLHIMLTIYRATKLLDEGRLNRLTVAEALALLPKLNRLENFFIIGFLCVISCLCYEEVMNGPAEYFIGKLKAFNLMNPKSVVFGNYFPKDCTASYVDGLTAPYKEKIVLNAQIKTVIRDDEGVKVVMEDGTISDFDKIVFACNADQALALLETPTADEQKLLGAWKYKDVPMIVHNDADHAPKRPLCQPWTAIQSPKNGMPHFSIYYCSWLLCPATAKSSKYFSTQHPNFPIREESIDFQKTFRVPLVDFDSFAAGKQLPSLNGRMHTYFCGSHFGYCLHGHAVDSAIQVARQIGIDCRKFD